MFCRDCGKEIHEKAVVCVHCGVPTLVPQKTSGESRAALRMVLPIDRSGYAIAAGYLGLFSVLLVFAPFALLFGILGVRDIKKHTNKLGMGRSVFGIIMGAIGTIVLIGLLLFSLFN